MLFEMIINAREEHIQGLQGQRNTQNVWTGWPGGPSQEGGGEVGLGQLRKACGGTGPRVGSGWEGTVLTADGLSFTACVSKRCDVRFGHTLLSIIPP